MKSKGEKFIPQIPHHFSLWFSLVITMAPPGRKADAPKKDNNKEKKEKKRGESRASRLLKEMMKKKEEQDETR